MSEYFPKSKSTGEKVKVQLDLSKYETKADIKSTTDTLIKGWFSNVKIKTW